MKWKNEAPKELVDVEKPLPQEQRGFKGVYNRFVDWRREKKDVKSLGKLEGAFQNANEKAAKATGDYEQSDRDLQILIQRHTTLKGQVDNLRSHPSMAGAPLAAAEKELGEYDERIRIAQAERDTLRSKLETVNNAKASLETEEKVIADRAIERVDKRLTPRRENLNAVTSQIEQLNKEIGLFKLDRVRVGDKKKDLEKQIEGASGWLKKILKTDVEKINDAVRRMDDLIEDRRLAVIALSKRVEPLQSEVAQYENKRNRIARFTTNKDNRYATPPSSPVIPNVTPASFSTSALPPRGGRRPAAAAAGPAAAPRAPGAPTVPQATPEGYIKEWNKRFGSSFRIDEKKFRDHVNNMHQSVGTPALGNSVDVNLVENLIASYANLNHPKKTASEMDDNFKIVRATITP